MNSSTQSSAEDSNAINILYVGSGAENRYLLELIFQYDYNFSHCAYDQCLQQVLDNRPGIVILELDNHESSILQVGQTVSEQLDHCDTSIIYISGDASNAMRFRCYNSGGDDFISKPFDLRELVNKVDILLKSKNAEREIQENQRQAYKLVTTSLSVAGEQGVVLHFFQDNISTNDYASLASGMLDAIATLGLNGSLAIWADHETTYYSNTGNTQPIEKSILEVSNSKKAGKTTTHGLRCLLQGKHVSLLIRNLPDDEEKSGRYKDILAMLTDALDLLSNQISLKTQLSRSETQLTQTMLLTTQSITTLKNRTAISRSKIKQATEELISQVEHKVTTLGLTEEQENEMIEMVMYTENKIDQEVAESLGLEEEMEKILEMSQELRWQSSH